MNIKEIKEMINLMNENNLAELELEREGLKIKLRKAGAPGSGGNIPVYLEKTVTAAALPAADKQSAPPAGLPEAKSNLLEIKAPMVGTFYRAPAPEAAPFVDVGQEIEIGQVICIIEAMKLMNEIKSDVKGTVRKIWVNNSDPVQFGQVLFSIEPA